MKYVEITKTTVLVDGKEWNNDMLIDFFEDTYQAFTGVIEAEREKDGKKFKDWLKDFCDCFDIIERNHLTDSYLGWKQASEHTDESDELEIEYQMAECGDRLN